MKPTLVVGFVKQEDGFEDLLRQIRPEEEYVQKVY
jgi:hypothetical protein